MNVYVSKQMQQISLTYDMLHHVCAEIKCMKLSEHRQRFLASLYYLNSTLVTKDGCVCMSNISSSS